VSDEVVVKAQEYKDQLEARRRAGFIY